MLRESWQKGRNLFIIQIFAGCHTEGAILSGKMTVTGRNSGETVKAPKGQVSIMEIISQAKGQSKTGIALVQYCFSEVESIGLAFYYL